MISPILSRWMLTKWNIFQCRRCYARKDSRVKMGREEYESLGRVISAGHCNSTHKWCFVCFKLDRLGWRHHQKMQPTSSSWTYISLQGRHKFLLGASFARHYLKGSSAIIRQPTVGHTTPDRGLAWCCTWLDVSEGSRSLNVMKYELQILISQWNNHCLNILQTYVCVRTVKYEVKEEVSFLTLTEKFANKHLRVLLNYWEDIPCGGETRRKSFSWPFSRYASLH